MMKHLIIRTLIKVFNRFKHEFKLFLKFKATPYLIKKILRRKCIWLELGLNQKKDSNWVTLSIESESDLTYDLLKGIPFPDNSIDLIYTSHTLEHFSFEEINFVLSECYRSLKKGGELSIAVPNARDYVHSYLKQEIIKGDCQKMYGTSSPIDGINYIAYMGGHHKYMFDETNLLKLILNNPFSKAKLRSFDKYLDKRQFSNQIFAIAIK